MLPLLRSKQQQKRFLSFLVIWNWNNKYVHPLPQFPRKSYPTPDQNGHIRKRKAFKKNTWSENVFNSTEKRTPARRLCIINNTCLSPPVSSPKQNCASVSNVFNFSCDDCNTHENLGKKGCAKFGRGCLFVCLFSHGLSLEVNKYVARLRDHCSKIPNGKDR